MASSGPTRSSVTQSSSSGGTGAVRRRAAMPACAAARVAQRAHQVRHVAVPLHEARAPQHALERLLHEVFRVLA